MTDKARRGFIDSSVMRFINSASIFFLTSSFVLEFILGLAKADALVFSVSTTNFCLLRRFLAS